MKKIVTATAILLNILQIHSQSYEGYIGENIPIWLEITQSKIDKLNGSYFYKKNGGSIPLSGIVKGNNISLNERNKTGDISGVFECVSYTDSLIGAWKNAKTNKLLLVKLYTVDPSFKTYSKIPSANKLILTTGETLINDLTDNSGEAGKKPKINYSYAEKSIISTNFYWEGMGAYLSNGTVYHTFNLTNNKEIILTEAIDPNKLVRFRDIIKIRLQKKLDDFRKEYDEEVWIDVFGDKETFDVSFKVNEIADSIINNYYLKRGFLVISIDHFFGFPHVSQAMEFSTEIQISFSELAPYLNSTSILLNLK